MDDLAALPAALPPAALLAIFKHGGRPAALHALRDAGVSSLPQRQQLATAAARVQREEFAGPVITISAVPQPGIAPIAVRAEAGLCNKLRCILSYRLAARDAGRHLIVYWIRGSACPADFDELFEPLEGVTIFSDDAPLTEALYAMQLETAAIPSEFGTHPRIAGTRREEQMYLDLVPKPPLQRAIAETVSACSLHGAFAAVHIRRTDYTTTFGLSTPDVTFERFIDGHVGAGKECQAAFVATDNAETQERFTSNLPACTSYKPISPHQLPHALRHTSVADAVVDLFTCAAAKLFKGTLGSSFTDTIWLMRKARGTAHAHDELEDDASFHSRIAAHASQQASDSGLVLQLPLPLSLRQAMAAQAPRDAYTNVGTDPNTDSKTRGRSVDPPPQITPDTPTDTKGPAPFAWLLRDALPASGELAGALLTTAVRYLDDGLAPPDVPDALCSTHWLPLVPETWPASPQAARASRHALEVAALAVARAAARSDLPPLRGACIAGLEWWLQEQWPTDMPKEWHTDKAVGLVRDGAEDDGIVECRPLMSSVLYLCDCGGPTVVVGSREECIERAAVANAEESVQASIAFPCARSLLLFDGALLHAVLNTPDPPLGCAPTAEQPRRTMLVNFWSEIPPGAMDVPLPTLPPCTELAVAEASSATLCVAAAAPRLQAALADDVAVWKRQLLPPTVLAAIRQAFDANSKEPPPLLTVAYSGRGCGNATVEVS